MNLGFIKVKPFIRQKEDITVFLHPEFFRKEGKGTIFVKIIGIGIKDDAAGALDDVSGSVFSQVGYTGEISRIIVFRFHDFLGPGIHGRINPEAVIIEGAPGFFRSHVHLFLQVC